MKKRWKDRKKLKKERSANNGNQELSWKERRKKQMTKWRGRKKPTYLELGRLTAEYNERKARKKANKLRGINRKRYDSKNYFKEKQNLKTPFK